MNPVPVKVSLSINQGSLDILGQGAQEPLGKSLVFGSSQGVLETFTFTNNQLLQHAQGNLLSIGSRIFNRRRGDCSCLVCFLGEGNAVHLGNPDPDQYRVVN